jgi:hypothetical protein
VKISLVLEKEKQKKDLPNIHAFNYAIDLQNQSIKI